MLRNLRLSQIRWIWRRIRDFKVLSLKSSHKVQKYDTLHRPEDSRRAERRAQIREQSETATLIPEAEWQAYVACSGDTEAARYAGPVTAGVDAHLCPQQLVDRNRDALI